MNDSYHRAQWFWFPVLFVYQLEFLDESQSDLPAHFHVEITGLAGYQPRITEFLFDDDERLVWNMRVNAQGEAFIISKPGKTEPPFQQQFTYTITLQKN